MLLLYCMRGLTADVFSRRRMVLRRRRSIKCASQAGYRFLGRSILITGPSCARDKEEFLWRRAGEAEGEGLTWKTGRQLSLSLSLSPGTGSPVSLVLGRVLGGLVMTMSVWEPWDGVRQASITPTTPPAPTTPSSTHPPHWEPKTGPSGCNQQ